MKQIYILTLACIDKNDPTPDDEIHLEFFADGRSVFNKNHPSGMRPGIVWDLSNEGPFSYNSTFKIQIKEIDPFFDDDLGSKTIQNTELGAGSHTFKEKGAEYVLAYLILPNIVDLDTNSADVDDSLLTDLNPVDVPIFNPSEIENPFGNFAEDKGGCKWILSLDGGSMKGIVTLYALREFERYYGKHCHEMFDMVAGTSTGSIIATMIAAKKTVSEIISLYENEPTRQKLFESNLEEQKEVLWSFKIPNMNATVSEKWDEYLGKLNLLRRTLAASALIVTGVTTILIVANFPALGALTPAIIAIAGVLASLTLLIITFRLYAEIEVDKIKELIEKYLARWLISPFYKKKMREVLDKKLGSFNLDDLSKDIFITAKDTVRNETTYLTAFDYGDTEKRGLYRKFPVRYAIEASSSAPPFFESLNRFVDGGVSSYNNPCFVAATEALYYSFRTDQQISNGDYTGTSKYEVYNEALDERGDKQKSGTVMWSFGTLGAAEKYSVTKLKDQKLSPLWIEFIMEELFSDSSEQQSHLCRKYLPIRFNRINLVATPTSLNDIGYTGLDDTQRSELLDRIKFDAVKESDFSVIKHIAATFANFLNGQGTLESNIFYKTWEYSGLRYNDPTVYETPGVVGDEFTTPILQYRDSVLLDIRNSII